MKNSTEYYIYYNVINLVLLYVFVEDCKQT